MPAGQFSDPLKHTTEVSVAIRVIGKEHVYAADNQTQSLSHAKHMLSTRSTTELCLRASHRLLCVVFTTVIQMFYRWGIENMGGRTAGQELGSPANRVSPGNHGGEPGVGLLTGSHRESEGKAGRERVLYKPYTLLCKSVGCQEPNMLLC